MARSKNKKNREVQERVVWQTELCRVTTQYPGEYHLFIRDAWHGVYKTSDQAVAAAHRWLQEEIARNA